MTTKAQKKAAGLPLNSILDGDCIEVMQSLPEVRDGMIRPPAGPGLGTDLKPEVFERPDAVRVVSE